MKLLGLISNSYIQIYKNRSQLHNVDIGNEVGQFYFWEYINRILLEVCRCDHRKNPMFNPKFFDIKASEVRQMKQCLKKYSKKYSTVQYSMCVLYLKLSLKTRSTLSLLDVLNICMSGQWAAFS
jgi:hypothetical protein